MAATAAVARRRDAFVARAEDMYWVLDSVQQRLVREGESGLELIKDFESGIQGAYPLRLGP